MKLLTVILAMLLQGMPFLNQLQKRDSILIAEQLEYGVTEDQASDTAEEVIESIEEPAIEGEGEAAPEGFPEGMPEKPSQHPTSLMAYFPYGYTDGNQAKTFDYYINHNMFDYCRYPMLSGFLGVYPAWNGDRETALKFYEEANLTFFCEPFYACTEWSIKDPADRADPAKPLATSFITARGSLLSGLIMGLTKMCPWRGTENGSPDEWFGEKIVLPAGWTKLTVGKIYIRGKAYRLTAEHGAEKAVLEEIV